jgi:hypothetical protein
LLQIIAITIYSINVYCQKSGCQAVTGHPAQWQVESG